MILIEKFNVEHVGKYICKAQNKLGEAVQEVTITIKLAPVVKVEPKQLTLQDGSIGTLKCTVTGAEAGYKFLWKDDAFKAENVIFQVRFHEHQN